MINTKVQSTPLFFIALLFISFLLVDCDVFAQNDWASFGIKTDAKDRATNCEYYQAIYKKMPKEIGYAVQAIDGEIFFDINSRDFYNQIFDHQGDGIVIEIISKEGFSCDQDEHSLSSHLLPPIYFNAMKNNQQTNMEDYIHVHCGRLPFNFNPDEVEFNVYIIQNHTVCAYHLFFKIDYSQWELLPTGLYRDSVAEVNGRPTYHRKVLTLNYSLSFQKNESQFNAHRMQTLLDSVAKMPYKISQLRVKAYSSIEGNRQENKKLELQRVKNIVDCIKKSQKDSISIKISGAENWSAFLRDIKGTKFAYLKKLGKTGIKSALQHTELQEELEPMLKHHRKATIQLKLVYNIDESESNFEVINHHFKKSIQERKIAEAMYLQKLVYDKIKNKLLPEELALNLEIPQKAVYGQLINNALIFQHHNNIVGIPWLIKQFKSIASIDPNNSKIQYNLTTLHLQEWALDPTYNNGNWIKQKIEDLTNSNISSHLKNRLWVNYHIINTNHYYRAQKFDLKDQNLHYLYTIYRKLNLKDEDLLSLAKYVSFHSQYDWAISILAERAKQASASEDLVFYYLRLTIGDSAEQQRSGFDLALSNAIKKSNRRFCELFLPISQGGYSMQLLDDQRLKNLYCANCHFN